MGLQKSDRRGKPPSSDGWTPENTYQAEKANSKRSEREREKGEKETWPTSGHRHIADTLQN